MIKIFAILVTVILLYSAIFAGGMPDAADGEWSAQHSDTPGETGLPAFPAEPETWDEEAAAVSESVISFFTFWNSSDYDNMLALCWSGWKTSLEDPRTELLRILANRTPVDVIVEEADPIAGEGPEGLQYYLVKVTAALDRHNGKDPDRYRIQLLVRKEEDGLWHINPAGLNNFETEEDGLQPEATAAPGTDAGDTVLYYQPDGGEYYHLDQNCVSVHPVFLPLQGSFLYSELEDEPYRELKRCNVCGAPFRSEE